MKLASFFMISTALHALAFTSPITFLEPRVHPFIPVTILGPSDGANDLSKASPSKANNNKGSSRQQSPSKTNVFEGPTLEAANSVEHANHTAAIESYPPVEEPGIIAFSANSDPTGGGSTASGVGSPYKGIGEGATGSGNFGTGGQFSHGRGTGDGGAPLIQASYDYAPKPQYPASARSEGKEGRVLLRVLVDAQGKTKTVEINLSSGSNVLDRAAVDAIGRWRFSPARRGDQPVESWVRIPIDFRLTDARD
jgi:TonB family protein